MGAAQGATITGCPGNLVVKHGPNRTGVVVVSFSLMVAVVYGALASIVVVHVALSAGGLDSCCTVFLVHLISGCWGTHVFMHLMTKNRSRMNDKHSSTPRMTETHKQTRTTTTMNTATTITSTTTFKDANRSTATKTTQQLKQ